jgi:hypothetical protein
MGELGLPNERAQRGKRSSIMKKIKAILSRLIGIETLGVRYNPTKQGYETIK